MKIVHLFLLLASCCIMNANAQLNGKVRSTNNQPLPDVSIVLLSNNTFIAGTISDQQGRFNFHANLAPGKSYLLRLSLIGHDTLQQHFVFSDTLLLPDLVLQPRLKAMSEVTVTAKKPLVTQKADRYVVNVEDSYLANGQNGMDVLQRSPGLWVSPNDEIRIVGSETVTVMINDAVQRMSSADLAVFLRSIRSEDISRIEVIPNPPAEFEAASTGGIIHIILKRARRMGFTGSINTAYRVQGKRGSSSAGFSADYKLPKLYFTAALNAGIDKSVYTGYTDVKYPDQSQVYNYTLRDNDNSRYFSRAGVVYDMHPKHSLSLQLIRTQANMDQAFLSDIDYRLTLNERNGNSTSKWLRKPTQGNYTLNYAWKLDSIGSSIKATIDHTYSLKTEENDVRSVYNDPLFNRSYRSNTPSKTHINTAQLDMIKVLKKQSTVAAGIKIVSTDRANSILTERLVTNSWQKDSAASDNYRYTEDLLMFYGSIDKTIGKTTIKLGLRGEQTKASGFSFITKETIRRSYFGWFPSVFISRVINAEKGQSFNLNYSRRVRRPGYNDLNPYRLQVHDFTILTGNPDLIPQYTHSFRAGYSFWSKFSVGAYLLTTQNYIAQMANTIDSIIEYRSKNFRNSTEYGFFAEHNITLAKIWNVRSSVSYYRLSNDINERKYRLSSFSFQNIQVVSVPKSVNIDIVTRYFSPVLQANDRQAESFYMDIGFTHSIFKDKGRLRFLVTDIFNTFRERTTTHFDNTLIEFYQKRPTRTFGLSFNYTFSSGKTFAKKRMESTDSDEKSRL